MKKRKLNQRRYRHGEEPEPQAAKPEGFPDEIMLEHLRAMTSMIEGREITLEEARQLAEWARKERETTPP